MMLDQIVEKFRISKQKHLLLAVLLGLICVLTFFNSLHNDFMMDDYGLILQESHGHNPHHLLDQFVPNYRGLQGVRDNPDNVYYRPWAHIIPLGSYVFFQNHPLGYHIVDLILLWLAALCVYAFIVYLFQNILLAFLSAVLFVVHPINGLTVNYITASVFSFQVIAMMLGLMAAVKSSYGTPRWLWIALGIFGFINALFCHESSLSFPFYLTACLLIVRRLPLREALKYSLPFWSVTAGYFILRFLFASLKASIFDKIPDITIFQYLATFTQLMLWYFKCLLTLKGIVLIWSTAVVQTGVGIWLMILVGLVISWTGAVIYLRRTPHVLWLIWIAIGFIPVTLACFFQPRSGLMIEPHWLIVGSIGFFAGFGSLLAALWSRIPRALWLSGTGIIMASLVWTSWGYNRLWGNEEKYCRYWHEQTPRLKSVFFYLAGTYFQKKDWPHAKEFYYKALENEFLDYEVFNNLGLIAMEEGDLLTAQEYFLKALRVHPNSSIALVNLAAVLMKKDLPDQAATYFQSALQLNPHLIEPRLNLADIFQKQGRLQEAIQLYQDNDAIDPTDENNLYEWIEASITAGLKEEAGEIAERFLKLSENAERLTQVGSLLARHGLVTLAIRYFEKVLRIHPEYKNAYLEAGKILGNINDFDGAVRVWQEGQKKFSQESQFSELIKQAQERSK